MNNEELYEEGKLQDAAHAVNKGMNRSSEFLASKIVKQPTSNSKSEYEAYMNKLNKWKAGIKIAEFMAMGAIAIGPIDVALKAAVLKGVKDSKDPSDKMFQKGLNIAASKAKSIQNKFSELRNKLKNKSINEGQLKSGLNQIAVQTGNVMKLMDKSKGSKVVKESSYSLDEGMKKGIYNVLFNESGDPVDNFYAIVESQMSRSDYNNDHDYAIMEYIMELVDSL